MNVSPTSNPASLSKLIPHQFPKTMQQTNFKQKIRIFLWNCILCSVIYSSHSAQFGRVQNIHSQRIQSVRGGNIEDAKSLELSVKDRGSTLASGQAMNYITMSSISMYNENEGIEEKQESTHKIVSNLEGTETREDLCIESLKNALNFMAHEKNNSICALSSCPGVNSKTIKTGILGTLSRKGVIAGPETCSKVAAECFGCLSDFILLRISKYEDCGLSQEEIKNMLSSLIDGLERKIQAGGNEAQSTIILFKQSEKAGQMENIVIKILRQEITQRNINPDQCVLHVLENSLDALEFKLLLNNRDREIDVPMYIFPTLVQSMAASLLDKTLDIRSNDNIASFHQILEVKLSEKSFRKSSSFESDFSATSKIDMSEANNPELDTKLLHITETVLNEAITHMSTIDAKQDDSLLSGNIPILEFGRDASKILDTVYKTYGTFMNSMHLTPLQKTKVDEKRTEILLHIIYGCNVDNIPSSRLCIQILYKNQIDALREFYGRKYENILDEGNKGEDIDVEEAAAQCVEGFKAAALHGIPELCRMGQKFFRDRKDGILPLEYTTTLTGLLEDMMMGLESHKDAEESWSSAATDAPENDIHEVKQKKKMTWYQKLGARLLVMGINYGQGWLALQGIRKAAAERDKNMPKFPLF